MAKRESQTPEQIAEEKRLRELAIEDIVVLTSRVSKGVLGGFHGTAVAWKKAAEKALALSKSKRAKHSALQSAVHTLRGYGS